MITVTTVTKVYLTHRMRNRKKLFFVLVSLIFGSSAFSQKLTVYFFLSETCPICQSVSFEIKKLTQLYVSDNIRFIGIFPDKFNSTEATRKAFAKKYGLTFELEHDSAYQLTFRFNATITPEVVVWNEENQNILYRGKVDNSFASIGKRRTVVTEYYLRSALSNWKEGNLELIKNTEPVGCFIQRP